MQTLKGGGDNIPMTFFVVQKQSTIAKIAGRQPKTILEVHESCTGVHCAADIRLSI